LERCLSFLSEWLGYLVCYGEGKPGSDGLWRVCCGVNGVCVGSEVCNVKKGVYSAVSVVGLCVGFGVAFGPFLSVYLLPCGEVEVLPPGCDSVEDVWSACA
jgi:hypothetical protein